MRAHYRLARLTPRVPCWRPLPAIVSLLVAVHAGSATSPLKPFPLAVRVGDRAVSLRWEPPAELRPDGYQVWRAVGRGEPTPVTDGLVRATTWADLAVTNRVSYRYLVRAVIAGGEVASSATVVAKPRPFANDAEFLELVQGTAFDYFWHEANPANGLIKDRSTADSFCSIAAVGFGLTAMGIGIDHGWITREQGRARVLTTLRTFARGPQGEAASGVIGHRGWFYHFLDLASGVRFKQVELSSIDTALFLAGAVYAREYFDRAHPEEQEIRGLADALLARVDWHWMANGRSTLAMGWHPETGFIPAQWVGYNEAMILLLLGLGTPDHPLPPEFWRAWTSGYRWETHFGQSFVVFPPLFGHQYSHCWVDFRGVADDWLRARGLTYFENSRRATLAQRQYCIANPRGFAGYGPLTWGLTACDGPDLPGTFAYMARGAPPPENDDGTLAPTAVGGSLPFAPELALPALRHLYRAYRERLWCAYGFRDAFNLGVGWWDPDVLGIDQGPILLMAENYRHGRVWRTFMKSPVIRRGLERAGFAPFPACAPVR